MLKILVRIVSSRWTKLSLLLLWLGLFILVLVRGWVWESNEVLEKGVFIARYYHFAIERTPVFVWLTMVLLGYAAHTVRKWSLGHYGLAEVFCGLLGGIVAIGKLPLDQAPAWFGLMASAFIIVRGSGNIAAGASEGKAKEG